MKLSPRQKQVFEFIQQFIASEGYPPTLRDIGRALGIKSTNAVNDHLKALERKGAIARDRSRSRGITVVGRRGAGGRGAGLPQTLEVPIVGRIAAGAPLLAEENVEGHVRVDPMFASGTGRLFALTVVGDSMIEEGIFEGDVLLVQAQNVADQGAIVVALVDFEATVKRFFRERDRIRLQPANSEMEPLYVSADEGKETLIQGVVKAVFRKVK